MENRAHEVSDTHQWRSGTKECYVESRLFNSPKRHDDVVSYRHDTWHHKNTTCGLFLEDMRWMTLGATRGRRREEPETHICVARTLPEPINTLDFLYFAHSISLEPLSIKFPSTLAIFSLRILDVADPYNSPGCSAMSKYSDGKLHLLCPKYDYIYVHSHCHEYRYVYRFISNSSYNTD